MGKRKEFVKKAIVCILIIFVGIPIAAGLFVGIFGIGDSTTTNNSTKENSKYIDGIAPVDIYGNLDKGEYRLVKYTFRNDNIPITKEDYLYFSVEFTIK